MARASAAKEGEEVEVQAAGLMRRISVSLMRENARSVLRRLPGLVHPASGSSPEAWADDAMTAWQ